MQRHSRDGGLQGERKEAAERWREGGGGEGERKSENMITFLVFVLGGGVSLCFGSHEIPLTLRLPLKKIF